MIFFLENGSQLGVFWPRRGLQVNHGTVEKVQYSGNQAIKNGLNEAMNVLPRSTMNTNGGTEH